MYHFRLFKYSHNLSFPQAKRVGNLTLNFPAVRFQTSWNDSSVKADFKRAKCFVPAGVQAQRNLAENTVRLRTSSLKPDSNKEAICYISEN